MDISEEDGEKLNNAVEALVTEQYGDDKPFILIIAGDNSINSVVHHLTDLGVVGLCTIVADSMSKKQGMD